MSKQTRAKLNASVTPKKPIVQVEGELTQAQLEALAAGGIGLN